MAETAIKKETPSEAVLPIPEILVRTGNELRELGEAAEKLQLIISQLLDKVPMDQSENILDLQHIDFLKQSLDALSDFLGSLSTTADNDWQQDVLPATQKIKILALARRLASVNKTEHHFAEDSGDCDFF